MSFTNSSIFIMKDGTIKACGYNSSGQLGDGTTTDVHIPTIISGVDYTNVKEVVTSSGTTYFLMKNGTVWGCGRNSDGQLGVGDTYNKLTPLLIPDLSGVKHISSIQYHVLFLMQDGTVKSCGLNGHGQLGHSGTTNISTPTTIDGLSNVKYVHAGDLYSMFVLNDGTVKGVGYNGTGGLGLGHTTTPISTLTTIPDLNGVKSVSGGNFATMFLMEDGTVKACGRNDYGQLGLDNTADVHIPTTIPDLNGVKHIECGYNYTMFLMEDGTVKACGRNYYGQLCTGDTVEYHSPVASSVINNYNKVSYISCGTRHVACLFIDETIKTLGRNSNGQLGNGTTTDSPTSLIDCLSDGKMLWGIKLAIILYMLKSGTTIHTLGGTWNDTGIVTPTQQDVENIGTTDLVAMLGDTNPTFDMDYVGVLDDGKEYKTTIDKKIWQQINSLGIK